MEIQCQLKQFLFFILLVVCVTHTVLSHHLDKIDICNVTNPCLHSMGHCHCSPGYTNTSCGTTFFCLRSWPPPSNWSYTDQPAIYRDLDTGKCLELMNGAQIVNGKADKAVKTNHTSDQWVDLGDLSNACITHPETCGQEGASLSTWVNLIDCPPQTCLFSTRSYCPLSSGIMASCGKNYISFDIYVKDRQYSTKSVKPNGWFHLALNYNNEKHGEEITVYLDGVLAQSHINRSGDNATFADGKMVIGRCFTDLDSGYASVVVDEMTFWNYSLCSEKIQAIYNMHQ